MVQVVTGDSQEEVMIFRYRHTLHHNIYIIMDQECWHPHTRGPLTIMIVFSIDVFKLGLASHNDPSAGTSFSPICFL